MTEQITMQALTWKGIAAVIGIILPIVVLIVWKMKQGKMPLLMESVMAELNPYWFLVLPESVASEWHLPSIRER